MAHLFSHKMRICICLWRHQMDFVSSINKISSILACDLAHNNALNLSIHMSDVLTWSLSISQSYPKCDNVNCHSAHGAKYEHYLMLT